MGYAREERYGVARKNKIKQPHAASTGTVGLCVA